MRYSELKRSISQPIFYDYQVERLFSDEPKSLINIQLSRMVKRGDLIRLKRGIFIFADRKVDEFLMANLLYRPSYISLESVLTSTGLIPETAGAVTSISPVNSKKVSNSFGEFIYSRINPKLYFGFESVVDVQSQLFYNVALPEKALLDWIYIRRINSLTELRVDRRVLDEKKLKLFLQKYPSWVKEVLNE